MLFFDEAQSLAAEAADSLLKDIEEAKPGVIFCFATTEFAKIRPALRSRLADLEVHALSPSAAIQLLKDVAEKERQPYEPEALALLASLKQGHPRDLILGLDDVRKYASGPLTAQTVREAFDFDQNEMLVAYFCALADGDSERQMRLISEWREPPAEKVKWVEAFLLALYYNDILGRDLVVDALVHSIQLERAKILDRFQRRLGVTVRKDLKHAWQKMRNFWKDADRNLEEVGALLKFDLFHELVNDGLVEKAASPLRSETHHEARQPLRPPSSSVKGADRSAALSEEINSEFFEIEHARAVINRASFLIQEHGVLFNMAFVLHASRLGADTEAEGRALVEKFVGELQQQAQSWDDRRDGRFAHLTLLKNGEAGILGCVLAHLPDLSPRGGEDEASPRERVEAWSRSWCSERGTYDEAISMGLPPSERRALSFHWDQTLRLCADLSPEVRVHDALNICERPLREILKIPQWQRRSKAPVKGGLLLASELLQPTAIESACRNGMEALSAFDDQQWDWIRKGWELHEYRERRALKDERRQQIAMIEKRFGPDTDECRAEIARLVKSWPSDPRLRPRKWRGWFHAS
jgi:hypothetical protein